MKSTQLFSIKLAVLLGINLPPFLSSAQLCKATFSNNKCFVTLSNKKSEANLYKKECLKFCEDECNKIGFSAQAYSREVDFFEAKKIPYAVVYANDNNKDLAQAWLDSGTKHGAILDITDVTKKLPSNFDLSKIRDCGKLPDGRRAVFHPSVYSVLSPSPPISDNTPISDNKCLDYTQDIYIPNNAEIPKLKVLEGKELLEYRSLLRFMIGDIRSEISRAKDSELIKILDMFESDLYFKKTGLLMSETDGYNAGILSDSSSLNFVFGKNFFQSFLQDPEYFKGVLVHEMQHYYDFKTYGSKDDNVRFSSKHEGRGHQAEVNYFKKLPPAKISSRIKEVLDSYSEGSNTDKWKNYLDEHQGFSFSDLDKFQKFEFFKLSNLKNEKKESEAFSLFLSPYASEIRRNWEEVSSQWTTNFNSLKDEDKEKFVNFFRKLETYRTASEGLNNKIFENSNADDPSLPRAQKNWNVMHNLVLDIRTKMTSNKQFLARYNNVPKSEKNYTKKQITLKEFENWKTKNMKKEFEEFKLCETKDGDSKSKRKHVR